MAANKVYEKALYAAFEEMSQVREKERELAFRKAQLQQTVSALYPLVFPDTPDLNSMSLPNAMRLIMHSAGRNLTAHDFKTKLEDLGFDISKFDNPLANIHTAMTRMVDSDEFYWAEKEEGKKKVGPGPELKSVPSEIPETLPPPSFTPDGEAWETVIPGLNPEPEEEK